MHADVVLVTKSIMPELNTIPIKKVASALCRRWKIPPHIAQIVML